MHFAGYAVDRLVMDGAASALVPREDSSLSVTLSIRRCTFPAIIEDVAIVPAKRPRSVLLPSDDPFNPPPKRQAVAPVVSPLPPFCRLCASSCCSTNSLCKNNICQHQNEEISEPTPNSPLFSSRPDNVQDGNKQGHECVHGHGHEHRRAHRHGHGRAHGHTHGHGHGHEHDHKHGHSHEHGRERGQERDLEREHEREHDEHGLEHKHDHEREHEPEYRHESENEHGYDHGLRHRHEHKHKNRQEHELEREYERGRVPEREHEYDRGHNLEHELEHGHGYGHGHGHGDQRSKEREHVNEPNRDRECDPEIELEHEREQERELVPLLAHEYEHIDQDKHGFDRHRECNRERGHENEHGSGGHDQGECSQGKASKLESGRNAKMGMKHGHSIDRPQGSDSPHGHLRVSVAPANVHSAFAEETPSVSNKELSSQHTHPKPQNNRTSIAQRPPFQIHGRVTASTLSGSDIQKTSVDRTPDSAKNFASISHLHPFSSKDLDEKHQKPPSLSQTQKQQFQRRERSSEQQKKQERCQQKRRHLDSQSSQREQEQQSLALVTQSNINHSCNQSRDHSRQLLVDQSQSYVARTSLQQPAASHPFDTHKAAIRHRSGATQAYSQHQSNHPGDSRLTTEAQHVSTITYKHTTPQSDSLITMGTRGKSLFAPSSLGAPLSSKPSSTNSAAHPHSSDVPIPLHDQSRHLLLSSQDQHEQEHVKALHGQVQPETQCSPPVFSAPCTTESADKGVVTTTVLPADRPLLATRDAHCQTQIMSITPQSMATPQRSAGTPHGSSNYKEGCLPSNVVPSGSKTLSLQPPRAPSMDAGSNSIVASRSATKVVPLIQPLTGRNINQTMPVRSETVCDGNQQSPPSTPAETVTISASNRVLPELSCMICGGAKFSNELELRRHEYEEHKDERPVSRTPEGRYLCFMYSCTQSFVRRHVMERHFKTVHLMLRDFPCQNCDKAFADSSTREAHRTAVHEKKKPWICHECSSSFTQSSSLGKHRRRFHPQSEMQPSSK